MTAPRALRVPFLTLAVALLGGLGLAQFAFYLAPTVLHAPAPEQNLAGIWELCLPSAPPARRPTLSETALCAWKPTPVPADLGGVVARSGGWAVYRKRFPTPPSCRASNAACRLVIGEVGDAVEAELNGLVLGRRGDFPPHALYGKHYPVEFDLSRDWLRAEPAENELVLMVHSMKRAQAGLRRGPVAIFPPAKASQIIRSITALTVVIPLTCAMGLLLIGFISLVSAAYRQSGDPKLHAFIRYCLIGGLFLVSFSEIPREYLPIALAGHVHYLLRTLSDWTLFHLVASFFRVPSWIKRVFPPLYAATSAAFVLEYLGSWGFDAAFLTMRIAVPLVLAPIALGFWGALREKPGRDRTLAILLFSVLLPMQISDILVFHGIYTIPYFVKFYPLFIGLAFGGLVLEEQQTERRRLLLAEQRATYAAQVAHDIRSPLAALHVAVEDLSQLPEDHRLLFRSAVARIQDIANNLLDRKVRETLRGTAHAMAVEAEPTVLLLSGLVDGVVSEKRLQYRSRLGLGIYLKLDTTAYGLFARVQAPELKRLLSNVIDNAVEAIENAGTVQVWLGSRSGEVQIGIEDDGIGIPERILPQLTRRGASFGKPGGSGLGLYHARTALESWGGTLALESTLGTGTRVSLRLPHAEPPEWFVPSIRLHPRSAIAVLDDDESIHQIWQKRFTSIGADRYGIELHHFSVPEAFRKWSAQRTGELLSLVDYELIGQEKNGVDVIRELGIAGSSILVTSHYEDRAVLASIRVEGVKLLPKSMAGLVPITVI